MALTDTAENLALNFLAGKTVTQPTGPLKIRLMTANGSDSAAGTQVAISQGYTGGLDAQFTANATTGELTNSVAVQWTNMPACTVTGVELWDSAATPVRLAWADIADVVVASGDTLTFAIGAIDFVLS